MWCVLKFIKLVLVVRRMSQNNKYLPTECTYIIECWIKWWRVDFFFFFRFWKHLRRGLRWVSLGSFLENELGKELEYAMFDHYKVNPRRLSIKKSIVYKLLLHVVSSMRKRPMNYIFAGHILQSNMCVECIIKFNCVVLMENQSTLDVHVKDYSDRYI